jgi:hypothetical protein
VQQQPFGTCYKEGVEITTMLQTAVGEEKRETVKRG